jgi:hypothetical protein
MIIASPSLGHDIQYSTARFTIQHIKHSFQMEWSQVLAAQQQGLAVPAAVPAAHLHHLRVVELQRGHGPQHVGQLLGLELLHLALHMGGHGSQQRLIVVVHVHKGPQHVGDVLRAQAVDLVEGLACQQVGDGLQAGRQVSLLPAHGGCCEGR